MKKGFGLLFFLCVISIGSLSAQKIEFTALEVNYGEIEQGADGVREFTFANVGDGALLITSARGSCGCTVPSYPKEPIEAGNESSVQVRYDTNRIGAFTKFVTLTTNDPENPTVRLTIRGTVKSKQAAEGSK